MSLLEVRNLTVEFETVHGPFRAVDGVDPVSYTHLTLPTILLV